MARVHRRRRARHNRRRARARHNFYGAGPLANRRRRHRSNEPGRRRGQRRYAMNRRRRHARGLGRYRRNPQLMGLSLPPLDAVLWVGSGLIVPPMITAQVQKFLPASWQGTWTNIAVKGVVGVVLPGMLLRRFVNQRAGNMFMVGGLASVVMDVIRMAMPGVIPGLGYQPLLGSYFQQPMRSLPFGRAAAPAGVSRILQGTPGRTDPTERF